MQRQLQRFAAALAAALVLPLSSCSDAPKPTETHEATAPATKATPPPTAKSASTQPVKTFPLNTYKRELDGQWQGIRLASDGNVYFASSTHSAHHGASFFKYDTKTGQVTELVHDITEVCGEDVQTHPQGKIHSDIVEANGWLYMATHFSSDGPGAYKTWSGSHALGYELASGKWHDYGVIRPGYTAYSAVGIDPARSYLYVFLTSKIAGQAAHVYRIHTGSGEKTDLGEVSVPGKGGFDFASYWMFVDRRGDVWFSVKDQGGDLRQIHGDTGAIEVHPNALPPLIRSDSDQPEAAAAQRSRGIEWMQALDGDRALLTISLYGGMLYEFDSTKPMGSAFRPLRHIGYNYLGGLALAGGRLYYYQRENRGRGHQEFRDFHLLSVALDAGSGYPITDYGLMVDQDGRTVWRAPGMVADGRGQVYMIGDWWTVAGDVGTWRYNWKNGRESYDQLPRGEFFAVASAAK